MVSLCQDKTSLCNAFVVFKITEEKKKKND